LNTVCSVAVGVTLQLSARFSTIIMGKRPSYDALDVAVTLLKRREGIDKTMKLARYALILAVSEAETRARRNDSVLVSTSTAEFIRAGTALERSLGNARRALRLGKFLGNVAELRDVVREAEADGKRGWRRWASAAAACAALEGAYYFLEQGVWLSKAGVAMREKSTLERLVRWSARAEVASYIFSIACSRDEWRGASRDARDARRALANGDAEGESEDALRARVARAEKAKRDAALAMFQDFVDGVLSFEDAVDAPGVEISSERLVNLLGLLAAALDFHGKLSAAIETLEEAS